MANANLQNIYNRLNQTNNYHPLNADTYSDWSLEAGDVVTVSRNGKTYSSPVHAATTRWNGQQKVTIESNGEKQRDPVSRMSEKAYSGGGNAVRSAGRAGSARRKQQSDLDEIEGSDLWVNKDNITAVSGKFRVDKDGKLHIIQGSGLYMDRNNASFGLYDEGNLSGGIIAERLNDGTVKTRINGHLIEIGGKDAVTVIEGKLDVANLKAKIGDIPTLSVKTLVATDLQFAVGGGMFKNAKNMVDKVAISKSGSQYTLMVRYADGTVDNSQTFDVATKLTGKWGGNLTAGKSYKVESRRNGELINSHTSPAIDGYYNTKSWASDYKSVDVTVTVYDEKGTDLFRDTIPIDTSAAYNAGASSGTSYRMYKAYGTNDAIYYGRLYNSAGVALTTASYYWFGCATNLGGSGATSILVKY